MPQFLQLENRDNILHENSVGNKWLKNIKPRPGQCCSVLAAWSHTLKGCRFCFWSGHVPRLQFGPWVGARTGGNWSMFLSHIDVSLFLPSLSWINDYILRWGSKDTHIQHISGACLTSDLEWYSANVTRNHYYQLLFPQSHISFSCYLRFDPILSIQACMDCSGITPSFSGWICDCRASPWRGSVDAPKGKHAGAYTNYPLPNKRWISFPFFLGRFFIIGGGQQSTGPPCDIPHEG